MMEGGMEIAFFGSSPATDCRNGASAYFRGIIRALHERGHLVTFYEPDAPRQGRGNDRPAGCSLDEPDWAAVVVYPPTIEGARHALRLAKEADLLIKVSGVGVLGGWLEEAALDARRGGSKVVFWDVDAQATLDRMRQGMDDRFKRLVPEYDLILTYGGGSPAIKGYRDFGAKQCVPIYNALDPATHYPVPRDARFKADLSFLGNRLPDREARMEEFYLRPAGLMRNKSFILGGSGWDDKPRPHNVRCVGHVHAGDHNAFNCSAKAVLNVCREGIAACGYSPASRIFEAAGAGACIITDYWEGIELFLEPGKEILVARDGKEVAEMLADLGPSDAREIGQAALSKILAQHTYAHRAAQFEMVFS